MGWSLAATLVIAFIAGLICFGVGVKGHEGVLWLAGGFAVLVGIGFNIANVAATETVTETSTQCFPSGQPGDPTDTCIHFDTERKVPKQNDKSFLEQAGEGLVQSWLDPVAAALGILLATGVAKLFGAKGPPPPLELPNPFAE